MNFTEKVRDYIDNENEMKPFQDKFDVLQFDLDAFLQTNKGLHDEYSIEVFEEILKQQKVIAGLGETISSMRIKNLELKNDILQHLELLKGGKLKLMIENTSYLISKQGETINLGRAFE